MTDDFEDAVRNAGRRITLGGDPPSYAGAWQRGRRRRFVKRAALSVAGACALVAVFATDIGRLPGQNELENEIASQPRDLPSAEAETPPISVSEPTPTLDPVADTPVPDSAPSPDPDGGPGPSMTAESTAVPGQALTAATALAPTAEPSGNSRTEPNSVENQDLNSVATPAPVSAAEPASTPTLVPIPTAAGVAVTPVPAEAPTQDPVLGPVATVKPSPSPIPTPTPSDNGTGTGEKPGLGTDLVDDRRSPNLVPADAVLVVDAAPGAGPQPCDLDFDTTPDATCDLIPSYSCTGRDDVRLGSVAKDTTGDGLIDKCEPAVTTMCDTDGDMLGDTPCHIKAFE